MTEIGFLGVAHIHTPAFVNMVGKRTELKATKVYDADPRRATYWAGKLGATVAASPEEIIGDDKIKAVVICSETVAHEALVVPAARAKKAMFVEKPLGMGSRDGYAMAHAIQDAGVLFQTGFFQRSGSHNRFIKEMVAKGAFGQITRVRGSNAHHGAIGDWFKKKPDATHEDWNWMTDPARSGVGGFGDLAAHALDILLWWIGDVKLATAQVDPVTKTYNGVDESGEGLLRFKSGAIGTVAAGWVDIADPVTYLVSGTEGHAAVINDQLHFVSKKDARFDGSTVVRKHELPENAPHAFELFLDALEHKDLPVALVGAREAAYRSAVLEAMYEGAKNNTWVAPK
jgi:predicted dehydrogenase